MEFSAFLTSVDGLLFSVASPAVLLNAGRWAPGPEYLLCRGT